MHLQDHVIVKRAERSAALSLRHLHVTPQGMIGGVSVLPSVNQRKAINGDAIRTPTRQRRAQTQGGTSVLGLITGCTHGAPERILLFRPITYKADKSALHMTRCCDHTNSCSQHLLGLHICRDLCTYSPLIHTYSYSSKSSPSLSVQ